MTGLAVGYRRTGTVSVGWDAADLAALRDLHAFGETLGLSTEMLTSQELRRLEPALAPGLPGGLLANDDHQVDSRALHAALLTAAEIAGARIVPLRVAELRSETDRSVGVRLGDGRELDAPLVVLAAGAWSPQIGGLPPGQVPVRPVKGQTLHLRLTDGSLLGHVVRGTVKGSPVYLVPREDGRSSSARPARRPASTCAPAPVRSTNCCATPSRCCRCSARRSSWRSAPACARPRPTTRR